MTMRDLIPWGRNQQTTPSRDREEGDPFMTLHREMNRLFDDVFRTFAMAPLSTLSGVGDMAGWPSVEVSENRQGCAHLGRAARHGREGGRSPDG